MFLSNPVKSFLVLVLIISAGCRFWQDNQNTSVTSVSETRSELPFSTSEPENFQCEMVVTAGGTIRKTFIGKKGAKRRIDFDFDGENQRSFLQTDKEYVIDLGKKIYAEIAAGQNSTPAESPWDEFTSRLLNERNHAQIEEIGAEGNIKIYKIIIAENDLTEILIYIDTSTRIPVKQEFFSIDGGQKTLQYTVEFKNVVLDVDDRLFDLSNDLKKVSAAAFYKDNDKNRRNY